MNQAKELIDIIGNTPIIQVKRLDTGKCKLFLKLEKSYVIRIKFESFSHLNLF